MKREDLKSELDSLVKRLEPNPARVREARQRAHALATEIGSSRTHDLFRVVAIEEHGSHSRDTAIRLFKDYDCLLVLDSEKLKTKAGGERSPMSTVQMLAEAARSLRAGLEAQGIVEVRRQDHSVGVRYPSFVGGEMRVDLVPALPAGRGRFRIPERSTGEWIEVFPGPPAERLGSVPARAREAIRLLKGWRKARGRGRLFIPSYAIEVLVIETLQQTKRRTTLELVRSTLQRLAIDDSRRRLILTTRGRHPDSPAWLLDPTTKQNILSEVGVKQKNQIVQRAREALDVLEAVERGDSPRGALRTLFLPTNVRSL